MPKGKGQKTMASVMKKFSDGKLRSGSSDGPIVSNPTQAKAIGESEMKPLKKLNKAKGMGSKKKASKGSY